MYRNVSNEETIMTENQIKLVKDVQETAFNLLKDLTNYNENEPGYGLTLDHNETKVASIAATGFLLSGYVIAVKYGYMSYEEALDKVTKTSSYDMYQSIKDSLCTL